MSVDPVLIGWLFLGVSAIGAVFTLNAFMPVRRIPLLFVPSFLGSWLTAELALHQVLWQSLVAIAFVGLGALQSWPGLIGMGVTLASWLGLLVLFHDGRTAGHSFEEALRGIPSPVGAGGLPLSHLILPFRFKRSGVKTIRNLVYREVAGRQLRLDVIMPREPGHGRPAIMQIHGGAWIIGDKREQGWPLMGHLAANGWVCFNVNYRLSPGATWPDHLVDLKYAMTWIRDHAEEYGVDPDFIAVTGGSAGGHLSTMMALTENEPEYQPGFEDADTSVAAAIPIYGVYDFTNRLGTMPDQFRYQMLEPVIIKAFFEKEPEVFSHASPIDRVHANAPPFLIVHGDRDTLAPVEDARLFAESLRDVSAAPVAYAELRGAQHAFDVFASPRTARLVDAALRFLTAVHEGAKVNEALPTPEASPSVSSLRPHT